MTEAEWLNGSSGLAMMDALEDKASHRKLRLFACARCRELWPFLADERCRTAIEVSERYADSLVTVTELREAFSHALDVGAREGLEVASRVALSAVVEHDPTGNKAWDTTWEFTSAGNSITETALMNTVRKEPALLREVIGNPFQPVAISPSWQSTNVVSIAQAIYDERAFDRMPILADALEDAGCDNAEILNHCRQPGDHVRGCWVVDLLLNKK